MLDSVTHSTFLPNASFCDPLMSWTDLFSNEEYYPAFEHQTGGLGQVGCLLRAAAGRAGDSNTPLSPVFETGNQDKWGAEEQRVEPCWVLPCGLCLGL